MQKYIVGGLLSLLALGALGQDRLAMGEIDFANSGAAKAQPAFQRGLSALYCFWYDMAKKSFHEARTQDPDFAMAYWGEALAHHASLWNRQDRAGAVAALNQLGSDPASRLAKAPTQREKDFLTAAEILFGEGDVEERELRYEAHMRRMADQYPEDVDVIAFYSLSILGRIQLGVDLREAVVAGAALEPFFVSHPRHPGVLHFLIHAYDDPMHAPLGLRAARTYAQVAPASAHALHMPSHIFLQLGMWPEVVSSNIDASAAALTNDEPGQYDHAMSWLHYAYLQQGRYADALTLLAEYSAKGSATTCAVMAARQLVESRRWEDLAALEKYLSKSPRDSRVLLAYGLAAAFSGRLDEARRRIDVMNEVADSEASAGRERPATQTRARRLMVAGVTAWMEHDWPRAESALKQAAADETTLGLPSGPPRIIQPVNELYGELLLKVRQPKQALPLFQAALNRCANRPSSLAGLALAAHRGGDPVVAMDALKRLTTIWGAHPTPRYIEVRREILGLSAWQGSPHNLSRHPAQDRFPAWSPNGGQIAFESDREGPWRLYLMNADGSNSRPIGKGTANDRGPCWHPDGKRLLFYSDRAGNWDLYSMDLAGDELRQLTRHEADDRWGRFSPDGQMIAFTSERDGNFEIYLMSAAGEDVQRLTENSNRDLWPSWSPDGRHLLFFSRRDTNGESDELYRLTIADRSVTRLTFTPGHDFTPAWSPDGSSVAWSSLRDGGSPEIYLRPLEGGPARRLTFDTETDTTVAWSPDGKRLAWAARRQGQFEIVTMPVP